MVFNTGMACYVTVFIHELVVLPDGLFCRMRMGQSSYNILLDLIGIVAWFTSSVLKSD